MKKIPLQNLSILIIGGAGFIGHNLALHLKKLGSKVNILDGRQLDFGIDYQKLFYLVCTNPSSAKLGVKGLARRQS